MAKAKIQPVMTASQYLLHRLSIALPDFIVPIDVTLTLGKFILAYVKVNTPGVLINEQPYNGEDDVTSLSKIVANVVRDLSKK